MLSYSCAKGYALIADDELACYYDGENAIWDGYINGCIQREYRDGLACYYNGRNAIWDGYINVCIKLEYRDELACNFDVEMRFGTTILMAV